MSYTLKIKQDTFLKLSTLQSADLKDGEKYAVKAGAEYPVSSWADDQNKHYRVSFGKDKDGNQISFNGRNTWLVFKDHAEVLKDGRIVELKAAKLDVGKSYLRLTPTGDRDYNYLLTFYLDWMQGDRPVDQVKVISGAPGSEIVYPTEDYSGSMRPCPEGVYQFGPVDRGYFGNAIGSIWIAIDPLPQYKANDRANIGIHEDANKDYAPGSAGCICPYDASGIERVAGWLNSAAKPEYLVVDHGLGFLKSRGYQG